MVPGLFVISFEDINLNFVSYNSNYDWMVLCVKTRDQMDVYWCLFFSASCSNCCSGSERSQGAEPTPGWAVVTNQEEVPVVFVTLFCNPFQFLIHPSFSEAWLKKKKVIDHVSWLALCLQHFAKTPKLYLPAKTDPRLQVGTNTCLEVSVTDCIKVSVPLVTSLWDHFQKWAHFQNSTN